MSTATAAASGSCGGSPRAAAASPGRRRWAAGGGEVAAAYTLDAFRAWNDRSRQNLGVDTIDLVQLHCPPTEVYSTDAVFDALDTLAAEKKIAAYGVSVETTDEALTAIAR